MLKSTAKGLLAEMEVQKLHKNEVCIDARLVKSLLESQFEQWSQQPLSFVPHCGTCNVIYRIGDDLCVRLPRQPRDALCLEKELEWLPVLSSHLSLEVPRPIARGVPGSGYPFVWAVYKWLEGESFDAQEFGSRTSTAETLAKFVTELQMIDTTHAPKSDRDAALDANDSTVYQAIESLDKDFDRDTVRFAWDASVQVPSWEGDDVWIHCDLLPTNILVKDNQLIAVIDFGLVGVGDPAVDIIPAWSTLRGKASQTFRSALKIDDVIWARARGLALRQALRIIPYYRASHPNFSALACRTVKEVLIHFAG